MMGLRAVGLMPIALRLLRLAIARSAFSCAVLSLCASLMAGRMLVSRCSPPSLSGVTWSTSQRSDGPILRPLMWQIPPWVSKMRSRTRAGTLVSGVLPIHSGTLRAVMLRAHLATNSGRRNNRAARTYRIA
jgi:hypothetical protein